MTTTAKILGTVALPTTSMLTSTIELSFRLMQEGVKFCDALKAGHGMQRYASTIGELYYETTTAEPPDWADFLDSGNPGLKAKLSSQHSSAVLLLEAGPINNKRIFAVTFGQGHHFIDRDLIERQFGLRVTLNSISRKNLRTLDSARLDSTVIQRRTQASRESDLGEFGFDSHRELLRLASGKPGDPGIAKAMSGKDALQIRKKLAFADLPSVCESLLQLYAAKDYENDFKFIDQFKPLHKGKLVDQLDALLFAELKNLIKGVPSDLHLAVSDILPVAETPALSYYGSNLPSKKTKFADLSIDDYVAELRLGSFGAISTIDDIRSTHEVRRLNNAPGDPYGSKKVYDCMVYETSLSSGTYVLFDGQWYEISSAYYQEVEQAYLNLLAPTFLATSTAKNERELIKALCDPAYPDLLCIDQTKVNPGGVKGANLEACDFLSKSAQLIHLKDSEASAPLSHLWNQGLVSAETLQRDSAFRTGFRKVAKARESLYSRSGFTVQLPSASKINTSKFTVVYGVLKKRNKKTGLVSLPFFSKVALRAAAARITMMGYRVELHLIEKI